MIPRRGRIPASLPSLEEIQGILLDTRNWTADGGLFLTSEDRIKILGLVERTKTEHSTLITESRKQKPHGQAHEPS